MAVVLCYVDAEVAEMTFARKRRRGGGWWRGKVVDDAEVLDDRNCLGKVEFTWELLGQSWITCR